MMLTVDGLSFSYPSKDVLEGVRFEIGESEVIAILGPNGAGKSTLLKCIDGILRPTQGDIILDGEGLSGMPSSEVAKRMSYVAQRGEPSRMTVFESILMGRKPHIDMGISRRDTVLTQRVIEMMHLEDLADRYADELSGGEYQLVQIARAFVQQPKVLLLDEPTSSLDLFHQHNVIHTLLDVVHGNRMSAVIIMHDLNAAISHADRFIMMKDRTVYAVGGREVLTPENIKAVYNVDVYVEEVHGVPVVITKGHSHGHPHHHHEHDDSDGCHEHGLEGITP